MKKTVSILLHVGLFLFTFFTTTIAGVQWLNLDPYDLNNFSTGIPFSASILFILSCHEFGHYFAARHHGVDTTLPFFLPFPSIGEFSMLNPFGTLGAVIRLRSGLYSRRMLFDIGSAGPLAGFIVGLAILITGFLTLPAKEYLYTIHPEYAQLTQIPEGGWTFGHTLIYDGVGALFAPAGAFIPPMNELYHYPFLCVGWFGLLVTAINLIPVGQLDGGHIVYAMFGTGYHRIAQTALVLLTLFGLAGFLPLLGVPFAYGYTGWLFWAFLLIFFNRILKLNRQPLADETPLDARRMAFGWACILIFIGSFSVTPFTFNIP